MTNRLRLYTQTTEGEHVFEVRWATGQEAKGSVHVRTPAADDGRVVAELVAARWLLEHENVCGHDKTGSGLEIVFSSGACKRLAHGESAKEGLARYALFLRTRFFGAQLSIDGKKRDWAEFDAQPVQLDGRQVEPELLTMTGCGPIELTAHAVEQYAERVDVKVEKAYREMRKLMADPRVREIEFAHRRAMSDIAHKRLGRYFYYEPKNVVFVATKAPLAAAARLVTVLVPDKAERARITSIRESDCPA